jgi:beta-galactosidase
MNGSDFLLVLCLLPLAAGGGGQAPKTQTSGTRHSTTADPRVEMLLRDGWHFKPGPESATELQAEPDAAWITVSVPHTWNRVGYYKDAPASHINTAQNVVTTQGVGWYKLVFTPPANVAGMESFLQFDAASRIATVWLNGTMLGTHHGGFSRFRFDCTAALKPGQQNALTGEGGQHETRSRRPDCRRVAAYRRLLCLRRSLSSGKPRLHPEGAP